MGVKTTLTTNADSEAFGIVVNDNGNVITGGYYMNNHHYLIPARWNGTSRKNLTKPQGGDAEIYDVKLKNNKPVFFGMTMRQNNMVGLLPKASYWIAIIGLIVKMAEHGKITSMEVKEMVDLY